MGELREIPGYPQYLASSDGQIYSKFSKRFLKQDISKFGYKRVTLYKTAKEKHKIMVHRLVAMAFLENPSQFKQVNHKNEIKTDNRVENLEWCNASYNINYGNRNRTVAQKLRVLKEETVARKIAQIDPKTGRVINIWDSMRKIERDTGIPHSNIYMCCQGKRKTRGGYIWEYI